jgi:FMN-dependent NADH-azoreductase
MHKLLNVHYTPRTGSNTAKLVEIVTDFTRERFQVTERNLLTEPPHLLLSDHVDAYYKRHYLQQDLSPAEQSVINDMYKTAEQLEAADVVVLSYPIYNFGMPAVVKAWVDLVTQRDRAFSEKSFGPEGLYAGKKALVLNTSGGTKPGSFSDFSTPHIKRILNYMGISEIEVLGLYGIKYTGATEEMLAEIKPQIEQVLTNWA